MLIRVRDIEACTDPTTMVWDSVWFNRLDASGGFGDWIMAGPSDPVEQAGGLRARMQLHTAIMLCLFTDRRLPEGMTPPGDDRDPRGWWGDSIQLPGEPGVEMGSLLWTLERSTLDAHTAALAKDYSEEALQVLLDQGVVASIPVTTWIEGREFLAIKVDAFDRAGQPILNNVYEVAWRQLRSPARMNYLSR